MNEGRGVYACGAGWHDNAKGDICVFLDADMGEDSP